MKTYWMSWFHKKKMGGFTLDFPWWFSGERVADNAKSICAAVRAHSKEDAMYLIKDAYDEFPVDFEWRFTEYQPKGWSPFSKRFPRADWMKW